MKKYFKNKNKIKIILIYKINYKNKKINKKERRNKYGHGKSVK